MSYGTKPVNNLGFMDIPDFSSPNFKSFEEFGLTNLGSQDYSIGSDFMNTATGVTPYQGYDTGVNVDLLNAPGVGLESISDSGGMIDNFFMNEKGGQGWGLPAIGAATGIVQSLLGFKELSEGKRQNRIANNQWQAQFDIQKQEYDRRNAERDARIASSKAKKQKASIGG